jgi:hypothetical protein
MPTDIARYSIELFKLGGEGAGIEEILDRHANLETARSIYRSRVEEYPGRLIMLCDHARVLARASSLQHKALAATSGAVGGSFGLAALPIELPISTIIMLRSNGDVARSEGEDLTDPETALNCFQVFALGGLKGGADATNSGYFAVRGLLAKSVAEAARFIVDRGVLAEGAPVLVRLIAQVASRFGVVVTQKLAAQAVPFIGAVGGAAVNYASSTTFKRWRGRTLSYADSSGATAKILSAQPMIGFLAKRLQPPKSWGRRRRFNMRSPARDAPNSGKFHQRLDAERLGERQSR